MFGSRPDLTLVPAPLAPTPLPPRHSSNPDDFEIIQLDYPFDPRITKFVGVPRGAHREPLIAIRRKAN